MRSNTPFWPKMDTPQDPYRKSTKASSVTTNVTVDMPFFSPSMMTMKPPSRANTALSICVILRRRHQDTAAPPSMFITARDAYEMVKLKQFHFAWLSHLPRRRPTKYAHHHDFPYPAMMKRHSPQNKQVATLSAVRRG